MEFYRIYSQTNDENAVYDPKEYATFLDAEAVLKKMVAEQGKKMNVASYISAIRKGKNRNYRKIIADALKNIFLETCPLSVEKIKQMKESIEDFALDCCLGDKETMDDFDAYTESGKIVIIEFNFDQKLHVEFDVYSDEDDGSVIESYFFMQDSDTKYKVCAEKRVKPNNASNILNVYRILLNDAYEVKKAIEEDRISPDKVLRGITPKKIQKLYIIQTMMTQSMTIETIVNHIKTLKKLGIPIKHYKVSREEKEYWKARNIRCNEGYEIDIDFLDKVPEPVDASKLGDKVNPLLVLFVMKTAEKPMRQNDIIEAILEKYNVSIKRAAVGRHIDILRSFGYSIERSKDGYILEK